MGSSNLSDVDLAARVARLTAGQRECLDLVDDHATSKEIARQLGISRHTVDARLRAAIQTLGVSSRREAAIIYRAAAQAQAYHPFAYQSPQIVSPRPKAASSPHDDEVEQSGQAPAGRASGQGSYGSPPAGILGAHQAGSQGSAGPAVDHVADSAVWAAQPLAGFAPPRSSLRLWGGANDLTPTQRMVGIVVVMILAMLAFGMFLSGIEALILLRS
ncbi:helix-turn-helix transcriptional regulator [Sandaracinobacter sp. RS1-74]|uniref:LuxR C-terminal-related transcriptional regulator n=1 Tax=Sandaracinobacteroides sayramensis TaxID=2913411 RepID=UPI001EDB30C9|nr:helix-turn-helix transcriptional regulator [Sandaracinobacteroides sayramensis]